jgi:hypothetical protein
MERAYCSEQNRHEPMIGTADQVDVWVLLEYRPAFKARAVEESSLGPAARGWLERTLAALAAQGLRARPQLVRQPEIDSDETRLLVGLPGALVRFSGRGYDFLGSVDLAEVVADPGAFAMVDRPQYFVCTNGQRDVCCARFGLPVYAGLRERVGGRAWQITHLGGHRFAPNVLTLPQGTVYGRVAVDDLDGLVAAVESDQLVFANLRGRAWYPPPVQAAEALSGRSDLTYVRMDGNESAATVLFTGAGGERRVRVRRAEEPLVVQKSCADEQAQPVNPYRGD